jgi:hypothetical protein
LPSTRAPTSVRRPRRPFGRTPSLGSERLDRRTGPCGAGSSCTRKGTYAQSPPVCRLLLPRPSCRPGATFLSGHRYHKCRASGPGLARLATPTYRPAYRLRGNFSRRRGGGPGAFGSQGRGGTESAPLRLFGRLLLCAWEVRLSGKWDAVESSGTHPHAGPVPLRMNGLLLSRLRRLRGSHVKGHELLTESGIVLRSDASTQVPLSAGQHACLARPSRLGLGGTPRATGSRS